MKKFLRLTLIFALAMVCKVAFAEEIKLDFTDPTQFGYTKAANGAFTQVENGAMTCGKITINVNNGTGNGLRFFTHTTTGVANLRAYSGSDFTVSTTDGSLISSIVIEGQNLTNAYLTAENGTYKAEGSKCTWENSAPVASVKFNCIKSTVQMNTMTITTVSAGSDFVAAPTISGTTPFEETTSVKIEAADGADIYYTTNGNEPTNASTKYVGEFQINATTTVKAIAVKNGTSSAVTSKTFEKVAMMTAAQVQAAAAGTACLFKGQVVAINARGALLADETGYVYYFVGSAPTFAEGDELKLNGAVSVYGGFNQFTNTATAEVVGHNSFNRGMPETMNGAAIDAWASAPVIKYVEVAGTLAISGNYYNVTIDGAQTVGSVVYPTDEKKTLLTEGSVTLRGYLVYVSGSKTKYANIVATSINGVSTNIDAITVDKENVNAPIYNLAGQRVSKDTKGILIKNGKKFINK